MVPTDIAVKLSTLEREGMDELTNPDPPCDERVYDWCIEPCMWCVHAGVRSFVRACFHGACLLGGAVQYGSGWVAAGRPLRFHGCRALGGWRAWTYVVCRTGYTRLDGDCADEEEYNQVVDDMYVNRAGRSVANSAQGAADWVVDAANATAVGIDNAMIAAGEFSRACSVHSRAAAWLYSPISHV